MTQIINVRGRRVHTEKEISSIIGGMVIFMDGSWCDVETGELENKGEGRLSLGEAKEETASWGPQTFSAKLLKAQNLCDCHLIIDPHKGSEIEVKMEGPPDVLAAIQVQKKANTLSIQGAGGRATFAQTSVPMPPGKIRIIGSAINIGRGNIVKGGADSGMEKEGVDELAEVRIKVPKGTDIIAEIISGKLTMGDIEGRLYLQASGSAKISVGRVKDTNLIISGAASLSIKEVKGKSCVIESSGASMIKVHEGVVKNLLAAVHGSGSLHFNGLAHFADLTVNGTGKISVKDVKNTPRKKIAGSGIIRIG